MKKNVRKRKKKKTNRYIPILASGLLIALTVLVISWVFLCQKDLYGCNPERRC